MEGAADVERPLIHDHVHDHPQDECSKYTSDGTLDINNQPALKQSTGNWRACFFILGTEFSECLCFFAVARNLVTYLTTTLHESNVGAARNVSTWIGTCFLTPLVGAFLADAHWGRYSTIVVFLSVYLLGMLIMTLSASLPLFQPSSSPNASGIHGFAVYMGLYLVALGTGGIKPCSSALGADQFDGADPAELVTKGSFFNWYYFAINIGSLLSATAIVWIQDNVGWSVGFGIPMLVMALGLAVFVAGRNFYRYKRRPPGHCSSPLTRVAQVVVAAVRNCRLELPDDPSALHELLLPSSSSLGSTTKEEEEGDYCRIAHTSQFRFLDKAAIVEENKKGKKKKAGPWKQCRVSQVEELKMLLRMSPVWASLLLFFAATAQMSSTLIEQGMAMDTRVFGFTVPPASLSTFDIASVLLWVPLYDALLVPLARRLTGESRGFTQRQRIGAGLALSALAMAYAAHVEAWRLSMAAAAAPGTEGKKRVGIMWQAPCYFVMGAAEVFASIGMLEYFYDQSPEGMKSLGTALAQLAIAGGNYLNSGLLGAVASATGWITDDLDEGHLDYFFWFMAALGVANLLQFVYCSTRHKG